jgi:hypothetical protein
VTWLNDSWHNSHMSSPTSHNGRRVLLIHDADSPHVFDHVANCPCGKYWGKRGAWDNSTRATYPKKKINKSYQFYHSYSLSLSHSTTVPRPPPPHVCPPLQLPSPPSTPSHSHSSSLSLYLSLPLSLT